MERKTIERAEIVKSALDGGDLRFHMVEQDGTATVKEFDRIQVLAELFGGSNRIKSKDDELVLILRGGLSTEDEEVRRRLEQL